MDHGVNQIYVNLYAFNEISSHFRLLEHYILQLATEIRFLHNSWELIAQNKLSEALFPPTLLKEFLLTIAPHLPMGTSFLYPVTNTYLPMYYKSIETYTMSITPTTFRLFSIIPLRSQRKTFTVYKPLQLPRTHNLSGHEMFAMVEFSNQRIAISQNELTFFELQPEYRQFCLETDELLCPITTPLQTANTFSCAYAIFANASTEIAKFCSYQILSYTNPIFWHLPLSYDWFYHSLKPVPLTIDCGGSPPTHTLQVSGSGFIQIPADCTAFAANMEFPPITETMSKHFN